MSGPGNGPHLIISARISAPPPFPVGANHDQPLPVSPVVVGGRDNVWTVTKLENGNYTLILRQHGPQWFSKGGGGEEVVVAIEPPPEGWVIVKHDAPFSGFTIAVPSTTWPTRAWTAEGPQPGAKVKLDPYDKTPSENQLWHFIPLNQ